MKTSIEDLRLDILEGVCFDPFEHRWNGAIRDPVVHIFKSGSAKPFSDNCL